MAPKTIYILYNANSTLLGKLHYGYRKLRGLPSSSSDTAAAEPACAACDITHGPGLSLSESPGWVAAKKDIEREGNVNVVQLHKDEVGDELKRFMQQQGSRYPAIVVDDGNGTFKQMMSSTDLTAIGGNPQELVKALRNKGLVQQQQASL